MHNGSSKQAHQVTRFSCINKQKIFIKTKSLISVDTLSNVNFHCETGKEKIKVRLNCVHVASYAHGYLYS